MMTFLSPLFFLLFLLVPIIVWMDFRGRRKGVYFRESETLREIFKQSLWKHFYLPLALKLAIFSLFVIILANPVTSAVRQDVSKKGIDIAVVFDISKSMLAEDIQPNRIGVAKKAVSDFVARFTSDRLSIVLFAGKPFLSTPLTFDYGALVDAVTHLTTDSIHQEVPGLSGTAIGDGLLVAINTLESWDKSRDSQKWWNLSWNSSTKASRTDMYGERGTENWKQSSHFSESPKREKVIILLTDWEANMGIHPKPVAQLAAQKGIKIYTIGLGDPAGTELYVTDPFGNRQYFRDQTGTPIKATLDEQMLTFIAETTGGKYYNAQDEKALSSIFDTLNKLTKTEVKTTSVREFYPQYMTFLWGIVLLLPIWLWMSWNKNTPAEESKNFTENIRFTRVRLAGIILCVLFLSIALFGPVASWGDSTSDHQGIDLIWVLDVSRSMDVQDIVEGDTHFSRLEKAKSTIQSYMIAHPENRYGLTIFAGQSRLVSPLTSEGNSILTFLASIDSSSIMEGGGNFQEALRTTLDRLGTTPKDAPPRALVVLSDGGDTEDAPDIKIIKDLFVGKNTRLQTIGYGSEKGGPIPSGVDLLGATIYKQYQGETVVSARNTSTLEAIAQAGGWDSIASEKADRLEGALRAIARHTIRGSSSGQGDVGRWSVFVAFVCFLVFLLPSTRLKALTPSPSPKGERGD